MSRLSALKATAATAGILLPLAWGGVSWAQDAVNLRMTIWSANEAHLALFNEIADGFKQTHPNVTVTFEPLPYDNYVTTLTTQIAGGNPPDLAWIFETSAADFVNSGALAPLTDAFTNTEGYDLADVTDAASALWTKDGTLYAYPFSTSPFAVFVNNDLVSEAGAKTPAEMIEAGEWTWDNALATAKAVADNGKEGLVIRDFNFQTWQNLTAFWRGWGANAWSEDGKTCTFTAQPMVDAMTRLHRAIFVDGALPGPGENVDFFAGDAAMTITQISRASLLPKEDPFDWDLVPLPEGPAGKYSVIGQAAIGAFANRPNTDVAVEFLGYMTNPENSQKLAQFFPPARASLLNAETLSTTNPLLTPEQIEAVVVNGITNGQVISGHTNFAQIQQTVRASLDALWVPDADVTAVLQSVCDSVGPLLAR
ncbi:sugar ABC transporter substrate-binding protein [Devosia sp. PTR5]|uniref:sn-glycerol-3-phosphate-binding periplasmic protein UgpB n=1 Tax=Devosia oryzisoli TaxID=2774138 RepID=A0A927FWJ0_9HYPH|nr:sugar ABC transporter substrate-binding protein [Devosia oryzisoli]MBD8065949.1 sugar ABC transporter substrate-binding protein [Devosia oryzisoli]